MKDKAKEAFKETVSKGVIVKGVKVYDPRDNFWKISDNPALIMADLVDRSTIKTSWQLDKSLDKPFWDWIREIADVCDQKISEAEIQEKI